MDLRAFIQNYPNAFHISASAVSALFGLTMTPTFVPLVFSLTMLLLYAPILFHRPHPIRYTGLLWFSITLCSSIGRLVPALNALSTAGPSISVLLAMSAVASAVAIGAIFADVRISTRTAIWTSLWVGTSHLPFNMGRLTSWTPFEGTQAYQWTAPWAVVISQSIGIWYMGSKGEDEIPTSRGSSRSAGTWVLALILAALTIPSFIFSGYPLPVITSETISSLSIGCALPPFSKDTSPVEQGLTSRGADLILWPEGAVSFSSAGDKDAAFQEIRDTIGTNRVYWAVSFEEDSEKADGIEMVYYKRFLVPIAESFALTPGADPPSTFALPLQHLTKPQWGGDIRTIDVTASICLDFAMPSPFRELDSKPALMLAPAHTWDPAIGNRMFREVQQRANEIGSLALWCDGGRAIYQVGAGSWVKTVGLPYPDSTRTFYSRFGDASVVTASWFFVIAFSLTAFQHKKIRATASKGYKKIHATFTRLISKTGRQPTNLIDL
ncbi:hypothetical protein B0H13DRAFT_1974298 [Mycena leptocephala]|nr:hypothetical protein B0H13DRAFT_1974298 [Mycena leptocephala]